MYGFLTAQQGEYDVEYDIKEPVVSVYVYDTKMRVGAKGNAKQDPTDDWDLAFGMKLAYLRAVERLSKKLKRKMIKSL